ncbi:MAG: 3'-5' exonuclease, partial [Candidatus Omnitrophica bacterium]|nr:3'-5' exonuclease [Candidatus Omnitrophota bacterium]
MFKHIEEVEFTIFDTETTGLEPESGDRIIEIAGIRFKGKERISFYHSLVNPQIPIKESALRINNIDDEMLKDAPKIEEVLPKFLDFIKGSHLCAYNAGFDMSFLKREAELINLTYPKDLIVIDLLKMSKCLMPGLNSYALISVAKALDIKVGVFHRALFDAEIGFE